MTTTNSAWFTTTNDVYAEAPIKSINATEVIPFSVTIADGAMDAIGDIVNLVRVPMGAKLAFIYYEITDIDTGSDSDIDFQLVEVDNGTTTTTTLYGPGSLGQAAVTADYILPAVGSAWLDEVTKTDSGEATIRLYQNAAITTDAAGTIKGFVAYR